MLDRFECALEIMKVLVAAHVATHVTVTKENADIIAKDSFIIVDALIAANLHKTSYI